MSSSPSDAPAPTGVENVAVAVKKPTSPKAVASPKADVKKTAASPKAAKKEEDSKPRAKSSKTSSSKPSSPKSGGGEAPKKKKKAPPGKLKGKELDLSAKGGAVTKAGKAYKCELKGNKWMVDNATKAEGKIEISVTMKQSVYIYNANEATIVVNGKCSFLRSTIFD